MKYVYDDGGRLAAGYRDTANRGDCGVRSAAIATGRPYREVYARVNELAQSERPRGRRRRSNSRTGVWPRTLNKFLAEHGFKWTPTMWIGSGCTVHLRADELPSGALVVRVSRHYTAVLDGVLHDVFDPSREGMRCVYGFLRVPTEEVT